MKQRDPCGMLALFGQASVPSAVRLLPLQRGSLFLTRIDSGRQAFAREPPPHRFQVLLASLGLSRQGFHDLRNAAASFLVAQGVDLRVVMEVMGHGQIAVTANTYAQVRVETTRVAAEQLDALLSRR